ncbi:UNVERIFIED_CONTAM: hypothetical protein GTU68_018269 [Idotea baltica]|nr:hypothetical protein [Idotea baltica]
MMTTRGRKAGSEGRIEITNLNEQLDDLKESLSFSLLDDEAQKVALKEKKETEKSELVDKPAKNRVYVMDFDGDVRASQVENMRREITAILTSAGENDEVVLRLESGGGMVTSYGLAASQLDRIKDKNVPLTICVDKVAASGGYMMACVADKLIAAPFAVLGSIGVVAQIPNFHKVLKQFNIDFEMLTAGKYKRTLTMFGENTDEGREKMIEDIERIHEQFKGYVNDRRPSLNIEEVATGEIWSGQDVLDNSLADELLTSDAYLMNKCDDAEVIKVKYKKKKPMSERFSIGIQNTADGLLMRWVDRAFKSRFTIG